MPNDKQPTLRRRSAPPQPEFHIATDCELIDFVDRLGVQTHAAHANGTAKITGWYAWLPHPHPYVRHMGANWREAVGRLLEAYKRQAEDTPA